jgi:serine/threonine protein kinase/formylglycine-generating enzyme required for sulfatase activity
MNGERPLERDAIPDTLRPNMPPATDRIPPKVPNHEMVRIIGRGAYGEIWLARSLTGTWRAVKIVDRSTFHSEKAFQREFEGMAKFEPISRSHDGFIDILHVGRDEAGGFFYYVMELADDHVAGTRVDPANYVPKTLKAELSRRSRLLVDECLNIGLCLTRALAELHNNGLVHRDIKPANIIFVGGQPKVADIGLVASTGQLSYVGTEGYVPPEGPGTVQADIYSLGKVIYEIAMGKDRLDFPEVNSRLFELPDKERLLQLNEVLLRACANDPVERYASAEEMHDDLARLRAGQPLATHAPRRWPWMFGAVAALAVAGGLYAFSERGARGSIRIETEPPNAMVVLDGQMKRSPAQFDGLPTGRHNAHIALSSDYDPIDVPIEIAPRAAAHPPKFKFVRSHGTARIESKPAGARFELRDGEQIVQHGTTPATLASMPTGKYALVLRRDDREVKETIEIRRNEETVKQVEFVSGRVTATSQPARAKILVDGKEAGVAPLELDLSEGPHEFVAQYKTWPEQRRTIQCAGGRTESVAFEFAAGSVKITSAPAGASVFVNGVEKGVTPLPLEDLEPGEVRYELRLAGFKPIEVTGMVKPGEQTFLPARFVNRAGPQRGQPWENSLGMKFVPLGDVLMCVWPVRVRDYESFCAATARARLVPDFAQDGSHPVVRVNWEDAGAFCEWLTKREQGAEQLEEGQSYRLPTDIEWSLAVGLADEGGATPEERDGKAREFPWGKQWPPPTGAGNFADGASRRGAGTIAGYHDGFGQTSPVGSFAANALGIYDLSGNVWQWCDDYYKPGSRWGVLRGGSWGTSAMGELRSSYRNVVDRSERDVIYGFRCVLVPEAGR